MKKLILNSIAGLATFAACSQDIPATEVPSVVVNAFNSSFKNATDVEWEKKNNLYEVDFDINRTDFTALIDPKGTLVMQKQDLNIRSLPAAVKSAVNAKYKGYRIDDADLLQKAGKRYYQLELEGNAKMDQKIVLTDTGAETSDIKYWD